MYNFKIISDSSCDLCNSIIEQYDIDIAPYYVSFDGEKYYKENIDLVPKQFYNKIVEDNSFPKTSLPSVQDYIDKFSKYLKSDTDIICFCLSSKFSGSYQSALNAANILKESYSNRKITIIDSMLATGAQGLLVYQASLMKANGYSYEDVVEKSEKLRATAKINFTVDSLDFLQKGGRIGKVGALAGSLLNIKPIITLKEGELFPETKVRGNKKAIQTILNMTVSEIGQNKDDYIIFILYGIRNEDGNFIREILKNEHGLNVFDEDTIIGVTIGSHTGATALGISYMKKYQTI